MKKTCFYLALIGLFTIGCTRDNYDDGVSLQNEIHKSEVKKISIEEVPFLQATLEKFQSRADASRGLDDLQLDLSNILELSAANGYKSYNIAIIGHDFSDKEDYYFETLHIIKTEEEYKAYVAKYNQEDDSKEFNMSTFTGTIELSDIENLNKKITEFQNGEKQTDDLPPGNGDDGEDRGSILDWLYCLFFDCSNGYNTGTGIWNYYGSDYSGSYGPGMVVIAPGHFGGLPQSTGTQNPANGNHGGIGTVANQTWPAPSQTSQVIKANLISQRLSLNTDEHHWLRLATNSSTPIIYSFLCENLVTEEPQSNNIARMAVKDMRQNPTLFTNMIPFLIAQKIDVSELDACTKAILSKLKNLGQGDMATVIARFENPQSLFTIKMHQLPIVSPNPNEIIYGQSIHSGLNLYDINLNSNFFNNNGSTNLGKAATIIHEIMHALIYSVLDNATNPNNTDIAVFPEVWNAFVGVKVQGTVNDAHHTVFGLHYVDVMAAALQEYTTGMPVTVGSAQQLYSDLAWSKLWKFGPGSGSTPFDGILTPEDKLRIWKRGHAEMNNAYFNGVHPSANPPCIN